MLQSIFTRDGPLLRTIGVFFGLHAYIRLSLSRTDFGTCLNTSYEGMSSVVNADNFGFKKLMQKKKKKKIAHVQMSKCPSGASHLPVKTALCW